MTRTTVEIGRPPDDVFAFVTDPGNLSAWQDVDEVEQLTEGPVRAGTRFRPSTGAGSSRRRPGQVGAVPSDQADAGAP